MAKFRLFSLFTLVLYCCAGLSAQYLENFTGQNNKGLVNAILRRRAISYLFQFCAFIFISALPQKGLSQIVIGGWDTSTLPGGTNDFGPSPYAATETAANVTVGGLTRGPGISTSGTGAARGWGGTSWGTSFNNADSSVLFNDFFTFTVKANAGFTLSLSSIGPFDYRRSATGPPFGEIQYQINAGTYSTIATVSFPSTSTSGASVGSTNLSGISALQNLPSSSTVTFRIVPFRSSSSTGTFYIFDTGNSTANDFAVNGSLCSAVTFTATPVNTCPGSDNGQILVSGVSGGTGPYMYSKDNGANYQSGATFTGLAANTYQVVVKDANGCTSAAQSVMVGTFTAPSCSIAGDDLACNNTSGITYNGPAGMNSYNWSIGGTGGSIPGSTTGSSVAVTTGNYLTDFTLFLTVTDDNGCSSTCQKQVFNFLSKPPADITVSPGTTVCFGVTLDLSMASAASSTVAWTGEGVSDPDGAFVSDGFGGYYNQTTAIPTTTGPHIYSVMVTTDYGCSNTGTASVTINPLPTVSCPGNSSVCSNVPAYALTGGSPGGGVYTGPGVSAGMFNPATAGPGTHTITYTVTDGSTGCTSSCTFTIQVTTCTINFSGKVVWEHNDVSGVKDATLNLTGSATGSDLTDVNGDFMIAASISSGSFTLKPVKNLNKLNGVTVGDATAVQQHVANITLITDNYKKVCADVNKSNSINLLDASLINQVILGNPAAHAQFNTSWRFVPTSHTMANPPWGFPEQRTYTNITNSQTGQDFVGMKIGDVTGDANPANFGSNATPSFVLAVKDEKLSDDTELFAEFKADPTDALAAVQFALRFDPTQLQLVEIQPMAGLPLTPDNFGTYNVAEGEIRVVWSQPTGVNISEAAPVFRLKFKALQSGAKLSEVLQLDESELPALSYTDALAASKLEFKFSAVTSTGDPADASGVQLFQNRPNPFSGQTAIGFILPRETEAQLRVYDVTGRVLFSQKKNYAAGMHEEALDLSGATGVLWYELVTPFGVLSRKMTALR